MSLLGLDAQFFETHWRKSPCVLRGAACDWIDSGAPQEAEIEAWVGNGSSPARRAHSDGRSVWFLEGLSAGVPFVEELVGEARALFEWDSIWCDLFSLRPAAERRPSSIGCHFDASDNFTAQLRGTKRWRLSPPSSLDPDDVRRRLAGEPDLGPAPLGNQVYEFELEPGDVLYIPNLWVHWGESLQPSLSLSLVIACGTALDLLGERVHAAFRREARWSTPLALGPGSAELRRLELDAVLRETFARSVLEQLRPRLGQLTAQPRASRSLSLDLDRVRAFIATAPPAPQRELLLPGGAGRGALQPLLARRNLRRLLVEIARRFEATGSSAERALYQRIGSVLLVQSDAALERICSEPEVTSWIAISESQRGTQRREDPLLGELASSLLPELSAAGGAVLAFPRRPDVDGSLCLRRIGVRLTPREQREEWTLWVGDGDWGLSLERGLIASAQLQDESTPLMQLRHSGPHLVPAPSAWIARHIGGETLAASAPVFSRFAEAMHSGAELLERAWPAAWQSVASTLRLLLPLQDLGKEPNNYSVHGFRGLVLSSSRRQHRAAQSLLHETGHNMLSTVFDLFSLCSNPSDVVISPVVKAERPLSFVFHGCYAFSQDIALTRRLLPLLPEEAASMTAYLEQTVTKVREALAVLDENAHMTPIGQQIRDEVAAVLTGEGAP